MYEEIFKAVENLGIKDRVLFTGYVPDEDLPSLYNLADVFVYPSFYEGFGMPVVEAMACGTPVIATNVASLPEIAGNACILVNPDSVESLAEGIYSCLTSPSLMESLSQAGLRRSKEFTWENSARKTLKVFEEVVSGR
jgi:glycosyltransferase involved in cell wall biosynthesis